MHELFVAPALSFAFCLLLTPAVRTLARRWGLIDHPDGQRKLHTRPVPVAGGLALLVASTAAFGVSLAWFPTLRAQYDTAALPLAGLLLAGVIICAAGVADDLGRLRGRHKLGWQVLAVAIVMSAGVKIEAVHLFGQRFDLGLLAIPFTLFVLLGAINSLNLLDGMDGLLSSTGLIVCLALGAMAVVSGKPMTACVAFTLAGALFAFLYYNFPPATIFLGDSGSMLIGLTVGVLAIQSSLKAPATVALAAPTALLIIPIFDTAAAILRRKLTGRSIYSTDRGHLHHCLLRRGLTVRRTLLVVACCCLVTVAGALASLMLQNELVALLSAAAVVAMLVLTGLFGHTEARLVGQRLRSLVVSLLRRRAAEAPRESVVRLQGSVDWRKLWVMLTARAPALNLCRVRFDVNAPSINEGYHARWDRAPDEHEESVVWRAQIPLTVHGRTIGQVELTGHHDHKPVWRKIAALAKLVEDFEAAASTLTGHSLRPLNGKPRSGAVPVLPTQASAG